jgi:hypothetical protein
MGKKRLSTSRQRARDRVEDLVRLYVEAEWDQDLFIEMYGVSKCFKCGSESFEEALDIDGEIVVCCSDCEDYDRHQ